MSFRSSNGALQGALLVAACAAALTGCGGDEERESPTITTRTTQAAEPTALRERLDRIVLKLLDERGLDAEVAECAVAELARTISEAELESAVAEIRKTGAAPPGVIEAAAAAGRACGRP